MRTPTASIAASLILALGAPAQQPEDAAASKLDAVRGLYAEFVAARAAAQEEGKTLRASARGLERGSEELQAVMAKMRASHDRLAAPQKAFVEAFAACAWHGFDPRKDAELLQDALPGLARDLDDPERAVAAGAFYLEHFGDSRVAGMIRSSALPMAHLASDDAEAAARLVDEAIAAAEGDSKAQLLLTRGDIDAALGDREAAAARYDEAAELAAERTTSYVTLRQKLIGAPAPEIDSTTWIGGEAQPLSALQGRVVLVDFWATWCGPCRAVMPALNELYEAHREDGLEVIGVTRFYERGYMAASPEQLRSGGESVSGMTEETFPAHVEEFRTNTGIAYPFVIAEQRDFEAYHVRGIPTLAVVDTKGDIALVTVGSGSEGLLRFAVKRLLQ